MRVALVHYWLVSWRGGEQVLKAIADLFPQADLFTHVFDPELIARELPGRRVRTTFIGRLPFARRLYQRYLPLMPLALEQLDLRAYDLIVSSEAGPAKGVIVAPHATHVCYCHSPMRYVWDRYHDYLAGSGKAARLAMAPLLHYLRTWDQTAAQRVDHYVANSRFVAQRIARYYRRSAEVIHPPVPVEQFDASRPAEDFYLSVGQLVRYKRADLLVEAFNRLRKPLVVIGEGELLASLRRKAGAHIRFLGRQPFEVIRDHYARCRAVVFPGVEDFGIVPVEAMASGRPVVAFGYGGVTETVVDGVSGVLFEEQTTEALCDAVRRFESESARFDRCAIRAHAEQFSRDVFTKRFGAYIARVTDRPPAGPAPRGLSYNAPTECIAATPIARL
jgi:glycosyltransferase involved in cell wall biosynthesis